MENLRATESSKLFPDSSVVFYPQPCSADMWHLSKQGPSLLFAVLCLASRPGSLSIWMGNDLKGWLRGDYAPEKEFVSFGIEKHSFSSS